MIPELKNQLTFIGLTIAAIGMALVFLSDDKHIDPQFLGILLLCFSIWPFGAAINCDPKKRMGSKIASVVRIVGIVGGFIGAYAAFEWAFHDNLGFRSSAAWLLDVPFVGLPLFLVIWAAAIVPFLYIGHKLDQSD